MLVASGVAYGNGGYRLARILAAGHAFVQNLRRGRYHIATEPPITTGSASPSTTLPSPSDQRSIQVIMC